MVGKPKAVTTHITPICTNLCRLRSDGFCPFDGEGIKAFQFQLQLSPTQHYAEVRDTGTFFSKPKPSSMASQRGFPKSVEQIDVPITILIAGPQEPSTQIPLILGLEAKPSRLLPDRLLRISLTVPYGTLLLWKCILETRFFSRYPLIPVPQTGKHPFGKSKWKWTDTGLHTSSVSSGSCGLSASSCHQLHLTDVWSQKSLGLSLESNSECCLQWGFVCFYIYIWGGIGRERRRDEEREKERDLLFHLLLHSLIDSYICPNQGSNLCIGTVL